MERVKKALPILGAHMSITGGLEQAIIRGDSIECDVIQIFTKSNRQWHARPLDEQEVTLFKDTLKNATYVKMVIAHASYLINLASNTTTVRHQSIKALADELTRCHQLGIPFLVLHPGSGDVQNIDTTLKIVAEGLDEAFRLATGKTMILLETMAGQGNSIGHRFEQLATIYRQTHHKSLLGVCLDTCHVFAAGYNIGTKNDYHHVWQEFDRILGIHLLKIIHLNDSKKEINSHVDRHEDIGKGRIGIDGFKLLLEDPALQNIPKILETPKETLADDERNLNTLRSL